MQPCSVAVSRLATLARGERFSGMAAFWRPVPAALRLSLPVLVVLLCIAPPAIGAPRVLVSLLPIHSLVASVMAGVAEPSLLTRAGQSPHDMVLKPSEVRQLAGADLIVWVGRELELPLLKVLEARAGRARVVELMRQTEIAHLPLRHAGDDGLEQGASAHGGSDAHIWLSPDNAQSIVRLLAGVLSGMDPTHAARYRQNADNTLQRLQQLDARLRQRLQPVKQQPYLVFHDAYQWLERHYELHSLGAVTHNPERQVGVAGLMRLHRRIQESGAVCLFSEPQFSPRLVHRLVEQTGLRSGVLDPLGTDLTPGKEAYFQLMTRLADSLNRCLHP
jgi:zinc transport system substrate-binding protein